MQLSIKSFFFSIFIVMVLLGLSAADLYQEENSNSIRRGAYLYVAWDKSLHVDLTGKFNPLWTEYQTASITAPQTWRCVSCHGWNYLGTESIEPGEKYIPGLTQVKDMSLDETRAWLDGSMNPKHNFSKYLTVAAHNDLIAFLYHGIPDYSQFVNQKIFEQSGIRRNGEDLYKESCRDCHGSDGTSINFGPIDNPIYLGNIAEEPWRIVHLLQFGHISVNRTTREELDWSLGDIFDVVIYTSILPKGQGPGLDDTNSTTVDYNEQADTTYMVYAAILMAMIVVFSVIWTTRRKRASSTNGD